MSISKVYQAKCDGCGTTVDVPESRTHTNTADYPSHWGAVTMGNVTRTFCTPDCAAKWIAERWPVQAASRRDVPPPLDIKSIPLKP